MFSVAAVQKKIVHLPRFPLYTIKTNSNIACIRTLLCLIDFPVFLKGISGIENGHTGERFIGSARDAMMIFHQYIFLPDD